MSPVGEGSPAVLVEDLWKRYGDVEAVRGVSFTVRRGEIFGLLGPNGAGKTTTVEIIEGMRRPDSGQVRVWGYDPLAQADHVKRHIGVALQSTALPDKIKVREALKLFASFYPRRIPVGELLQLVALQEKAESIFDTLSGGQQQRLAVALALVNDPDVIILDEPTAGLDPQARRELHEVIDQMRARGKTIILTTHYIEEAEKLCDRVAIIDRGKIIALDTPRRLIARSRGRSRIEFRTAAPIDVGALRQIPFVQKAAQNEEEYTVWTVDVPRTVVELIKWLESENHELLDLHVTRPTLEDVFIELTGRSIDR
ncbi:MAG: ABC transporter ATP-binding protein [Acidobacteria bacterium]|nr:MAG: ABC transporter ATP-binding protein [Acidobacteriota bacterium]